MFASSMENIALEVGGFERGSRRNTEKITRRSYHSSWFYCHRPQYGRPEG